MIQKRESYRKKYFNSGVFGFIGIGNNSNYDIRSTSEKVFGTYGDNKDGSYQGVLSYP